MLPFRLTSQFPNLSVLTSGMNQSPARDSRTFIPSTGRYYLFVCLLSVMLMNTLVRMSRFSYPIIERNESLVEKIFDTNVADPYRHLEDPKADVTKKFVKEQNDVTNPFLDKCPHRIELKELLTSYQNYKKLGCTFKRGNKYYYFMNEGLQPQSVLYQQDSVNGEPRLFFDPNTLSEDGTVALTQTSFSPNGQYFAYGLSRSGSDWVEIYVREISTGKDLIDKITRAKSTPIEWTHDNKGFFYCTYPVVESEAHGANPDVNENHLVYYHLLGTPQTEDFLKYKDADPKMMIGVEISHDGRYLHVFPRKGCSENSWYFCKLDDFDLKDQLTLKPIYEKMDATFEYVDSNGTEVYFLTNLDAPNYRVVKLDLEKPSQQNWVDIVPSHPEDVLESVESYSVEGGQFLLLNYKRKVVNNLELHEINKGLVKKFTTPPGTISKYSGRPHDNEFFFHFTSFTTPGQVYHVDLKDPQKESKLLRQSQPKDFRSDDYVINQIFYKSKDNTEIPMFIVHRKELSLNGDNPCILYGYGGFSISVPSSFNINRVAWLKNFKGILAVANIRGGGEFGKAWHDSGRLLNKQNVFDDFIAAGEYLIANNYTKRERLAIQGGSNGGLLVAATSNQRPDLFGASICHVGVLDMIRFTAFTIGHCWTSDYGDPKEKAHFDNLIKYSPYHNIPDSVEKYPATLLLTSDHDDRVVPAHSLKYIAQLQYKLAEQLPDTPLLIRVETKAGHGAGRPISKVIDEYADIYSFLYTVLDLKDFYSNN